MGTENGLAGLDLSKGITKIDAQRPDPFLSQFLVVKSVDERRLWGKMCCPQQTSDFYIWLEVVIWEQISSGRLYFEDLDESLYRSVVSLQPTKLP
jgi:hypothetical protein